MLDYSSVRAAIQAAHPAVAGSSQEVDREAVIADWAAAAEDFSL